MKILRTITIDAPISKVWEAIGTNYEHAGLWSSAIYASAPVHGRPVEGAPVSGRVCETTLGPFKESIVEYDEGRRTLAYFATGDKMPGFVKQLKGSWRLSEKNGSSTIVAMQLHAELAAPFNFLMGWMMKKQFNKAISVTLEDLKFYLENDKRHPRKVKFDSSKKAATARRALSVA